MIDVLGVDQYRAAARYEVVYIVYSLEHKRYLRLKVTAEEEHPVVPSVTGVWPGANWHERETFDMFGIRFKAIRTCDVCICRRSSSIIRSARISRCWASPIPSPCPGANVLYGTTENAWPPKLMKCARAASWLRLKTRTRRVMIDDPLENQMILNMGPQHPATHGVLRVLVRLDGETVIAAVPELGYLHRGYEKIAENCSLPRVHPPYRPPGLSFSDCQQRGLRAGGGETDRGRSAASRQYIRVLVCEMARIASHLVAIGSMAMDVGALTVLLWTFREREKILDIYDVSAARDSPPAIPASAACSRIGPPSARRCSGEFLDEFGRDLAEVETLLRSNRIFIDRCEDVGYISREDAVGLGLTGPILRAAGVPRDLRAITPTSSTMSWNSTS